MPNELEEILDDDDLRDEPEQKGSKLDKIEEHGITQQLHEHGIYYIVGEITPEVIAPIIQDLLLKQIDEKWTGPVQLVINSGGGSMPDTWALIDMLNMFKTEVHTIGMGLCCSAAAILLAAGKKGERNITANAEIMIHNAAVTLSGDVPTLRSQAKGVELEYERHVRFWLANSKLKTPKAVKTKLLGQNDLYLTPDQALRFGIVDKVIR